MCGGQAGESWVCNAGIVARRSLMTQVSAWSWTSDDVGSVRRWQQHSGPVGPRMLGSRGVNLCVKIRTCKVLQAIDWNIQECTVSYKAETQVETQVEPMSARMRDDSADARKESAKKMDDSEKRRLPNLADPVGSLPPLRGVGKQASKSDAAPDPLEPCVGRTGNAREGAAVPLSNGTDHTEVVKRPKVVQSSSELEIDDL